MVTTKPFQLGSISTGTLRTEALLPAFARTLTVLGINPVSIVLTAQHEKGNQTQRDEHLLKLFRWALEDLCPPFVYFGPRQCTGCTTEILCIEASMDFGFWPDWDAIYQAMPMPKQGRDNLLSGHAVIMHVTHDDKLTVMDLDRQVLWTTT